MGCYPEIWKKKNGFRVIASQRVGAKRRPMTGSAKQSMVKKKKGLLRRLSSSQ
jgi:hypothetical protein